MAIQKYWSVFYKVPLCMVDLAQTIEEWKDLQSVKVDDQVGRKIN